MPSCAVFQNYLHMCILRCEVIAVMEVDIMVVGYDAVVLYV